MGRNIPLEICSLVLFGTVSISVQLRRPKAALNILDNVQSVLTPSLDNYQVNPNLGPPLFKNEKRKRGYECFIFQKYHHIFNFRVFQIEKLKQGMEPASHKSDATRVDFSMRILNSDKYQSIRDNLYRTRQQKICKLMLGQTENS